ncbi:hypothetical protein GQ55_4G139500 [Panicum hallii var. hallii]|uniref:Uncharacterized protein n=1 Tax=Panicum hallii var. hallii TaxID=1504633 RepID=A0A2T7DY77_9POAL|nr:hypothetical protein GQ55_4G139500 [Panicum hallii var. hallii]
MARNISLILRFTYGYYDEVLNALPLERMPALAPRLLKAGVCFGFGDPVTNIIINTLSFIPDKDAEPACGEPVPEPDGARIRKRKQMMKDLWDARARVEILSKIVAGNIPSSPQARTIAEHSLEGLVTFLTSYFRYLPTWDALRYLCVSRADLLVAICLIELGRCRRRKFRFRIHSHTVKTAFKCAALSAKLPNVDVFLTGMSALVSHLTHIVPPDNFRRRCYSVEDVIRLSKLFEETPKPQKQTIPMHLAGIRFHQYDMKDPYGVYLKAISWMPMKDFHGLYHHGFLKAGYCYGPFNPFFNIIVNTVWYDTAFPTPGALELDMICTRILIRVESQSLDGLINLLLACISRISEHDAMIYLLKSNLELSQAIHMVGKDGYDTSSWDANAYKAAADASSDPQIEAYVHFVRESLPMVESAIWKLLSTQTLSSSKILHLSTLLSSSRSHPSKSLELTDELTKDALEMVSSYKEKFFSQQNFVRKKVEATLLNCEQTKGQYELRFICTVNESVGSKSFRDLKYSYSHINFWASPKIKHPVSNLSTNVEGTRIVHPVQSYCGGVMDFEKMATGRHTLTNLRIISHGELIACPVGIFVEDYNYFDPARDAKFIRAMNKTAWEEKLNWGDKIRRIKQTAALKMDL